MKQSFQKLAAAPSPYIKQGAMLPTFVEALSESEAILVHTHFVMACFATTKETKSNTHFLDFVLAEQRMGQ